MLFTMGKIIDYTIIQAREKTRRVGVQESKRKREEKTSDVRVRCTRHTHTAKKSNEKINHNNGKLL
jgi:hypothetical protein